MNSFVDWQKICSANYIATYARNSVGMWDEQFDHMNKIKS